MNLLPVLLTLHLVFLLYLLIAGTGARRAAQVWKAAFLEATGIFSLVLIGCIAAFSRDPQTVVKLLLGLSVLALPFATLRTVPDVVMPRCRRTPRSSPWEKPAQVRNSAPRPNKVEIPGSRLARCKAIGA